jgi:ribosomal protein S20
LRLENEVNKTVYSDIPWDKPDLMEVRQERGLDTKSLTEQEYHEEELRNTSFKSAFDDAVRQILKQIAKGDIVEAFNSKALAQEELSRLPNCAYKKLYEELFDSFSSEICEKLVLKDRNETDSFIERRKQLREDLGVESDILPGQTIDALTTAEYLFHKYVTLEYAEEGFDYSCISCLYYQAFEEAYNSLIWRKYAEKLNNMVLLGRDFTKFLFSNNRSDDFTLAVQPYFFTDYNQFKNYKEKNIKKLSTSCMYGPFVTLMKEVIENRDLTEFRDFFARQVGFKSSEEMQRDVEFMKKCSDFVVAVNNCIDSRNNASHGKFRVGAEQCKADKKNVLSNIESVRKESVGLIQQLLFLFCWVNKGRNSVDS